MKQLQYHEHHVVDGAGAGGVNVVKVFLHSVKGVSRLRTEGPALVDQLLTCRAVEVIVPAFRVSVDSRVGSPVNMDTLCRSAASGESLASS